MFSVQEKAIQTLTNLGLTSCQARVYLALVQSGISTVKTTSKVSKISRQEIYRLTAALEKLGLIEKLITKPVSFIAIPIEKSFSILLNRRSKKTCELQAVTNEIIQSFANEVKPAFRREKVQFALISGKETLIHTAVGAIENAQTSIDYVTSTRNFFPWLISQEELYKKALRRGVKIRLIIDKPEDSQSTPKMLQASRKDFSIHVRYVPTVPRVRLGIFDRKDLYLSASPELVLKSFSALWSNNPSLLEALQDYFNILWITALKEAEYSINGGLNAGVH